jgi:hypothetical protein
MTIDETPHGKIPGHFTVMNLNVKLPALVDNLEGEVLDVRLDLGIAEFTTDETFSIENAVKTKVSGKIKGMTQIVT